MNPKLIKLLIVGQVLIDLGFIVYIWTTQIWMNEVSQTLIELLEGFG